MSLENQIANLVGAANKLTGEVANKMKGIDQKVEKTAQEISKTITENRVITYYVDAANGSDSNTGSSGSPFKTLSRALFLAPSGSSLSVYLKAGSYVTTEAISCYAARVYIVAWDQTDFVVGQYKENIDSLPYIEINHTITMATAGSLTFGAWSRGVIVKAKGEGGFFLYSACTVVYDRALLIVDSVNVMFGGGSGVESIYSFQRFAPTKLSFRAAAVEIVRGYIARAPIMLSTAGVTGFTYVDEVIMDATPASVLATIPVSST